MSEPPDPPPPASLLEGAWRSLRARTSGMGPDMRVTLATVAGAGIAGALLIGAGGWAATRTAVAETRRYRTIAADAAAGRRTVAALAAAYARPGLEESVAAAAAHRPPDARLMAVSREADGALAVTFETGDPDLLRNAVAAEPWFAGFVERQQALTAGGGVRVTLVSGSQAGVPR